MQKEIISVYKIFICTGARKEDENKKEIKKHDEPFFRSTRLFTDNNHLEVGAQKKIVMGPAGCSAILLTKEGILSDDKTFLIRPRQLVNVYE